MPSDIKKPLVYSANWINKHNTGINKIFAENFQGGLKYSNILIKLLENRGLDTKEKIDCFLNPSLKNLHDPDFLPNIEAAVIRLVNAIRSNEKVLVFGDYDADGIISTAIMYNFLKKIGANADYYIPSRFDSGYDINIDYIKEQNFKKTCDLIICVDCGTNAAEVIDYVKYSKENSIDVIACDHHEVVSAETLKNTGKDKPEFGYSGDAHNTDKIVSVATLKNSGKDNTDFTYPGDDHNTDKINEKSYIIVNPKLKNPKLENSQYPFDCLSGAGVTFKFITAILRYLDSSEKEKIPKDYLNSILDLVAISTVADLMPLIDENRIIVKEGLKRIKNSSNPGLNSLVNKILGEKEEFNTYDIGFVISPRLNASGRMSNAENSIKLLIDNPGIKTEISNIEISSIIEELEKSNSDRKDIQQITVREILDNNNFSEIVSADKIFIAKSATWNVGVLGIAASEIVKKYNIPVILFLEADGILKGSGRSIEKFDLYENLGSLSFYFKKYGGHKQACGITMELDSYESFKSSMIKLANKMLTQKDLEKIFYFDAEISFSEINLNLTSDIGMLEPFGMGNSRPVFQTKDCSITGEPRLLKDNKHMVLKLKNSNKEFAGIIFNCSDLYPEFTNYIIKNRKDKTLLAALQIDILYNIEQKKSPYDDTRIIQLCIQSLKTDQDLVWCNALLPQ